MNALTLHKKDQATRERIGWCSMAFIAPTIPKPKTKAEKATQSIFFDNGNKNTYMMHVYDVLELMEKAYEAGRCSSNKS